jgi:hypothetical protein
MAILSTFPPDPLSASGEGELKRVRSIKYPKNGGFRGWIKFDTEVL